MRVIYSISAQNGHGKSSCWPWQHPGESPTYILDKDKHRTRANNVLYNWVLISYRRFSSQKPYYSNVSDVPRSLQSWVSTIQTVVLTADVFQLFKKSSDGWAKIERSSHTSTYQIHMCQFNPTLPLQQQLALVASLGGAHFDFSVLVENAVSWYLLTNCSLFRLTYFHL